MARFRNQNCQSGGSGGTLSFKTCYFIILDDFSLFLSLLAIRLSI